MTSEIRIDNMPGGQRQADPLTVSVEPGQVMFSTCCDTVHAQDADQVRQLRDALSAWLAANGESA